MMRNSNLHSILADVATLQVVGNTNISVSAIDTDSRNIGKSIDRKSVV